MACDDPMACADPIVVTDAMACADCMAGADPMVVAGHVIAADPVAGADLVACVDPTFGAGPVEAPRPRLVPTPWSAPNLFKVVGDGPGDGISAEHGARGVGSAHATGALAAGSDAGRLWMCFLCRRAAAPGRSRMEGVVAMRLMSAASLYSWDTAR